MSKKKEESGQRVQRGGVEFQRRGEDQRLRCHRRGKGGRTIQGTKSQQSVSFKEYMVSFSVLSFWVFLLSLCLECGQAGCRYETYLQDSSRGGEKER